MVAIASGKVLTCLQQAAKSEENYTDQARYEFPNRDPLAVSTRQDCVKVFERETKTDMCQPDNMELILKCHARYEVNQVCAFREYLKVETSFGKRVCPFHSILVLYLYHYNTLNSTITCDIDSRPTECRCDEAHRSTG